MTNDPSFIPAKFKLHERLFDAPSQLSFTYVSNHAHAIEQGLATAFGSGTTKFDSVGPTKQAKRFIGPQFNDQRALGQQVCATNGSETPFFDFPHSY